MNIDYFKNKGIDFKKIARRSADYLLLTLGNNNLELKISELIANKFNRNYDIYDSVIDSVYNQTHIGGSALHHNLDGVHTFSGVLDILHNYFPNDTDFNLIIQGYEHLARDLTTPSGINPFLSPENFLSAKNFLVNQLNFPVHLANDMININSVEIIATIIAIFSVIFDYNNNEIKKTSELFSRISLISFFSGNPAMLLLSLILLGQSSVKLFREKEYLAFTDGIISGTISTGSFFLASATLPGMFFPAIISGIIASYGANLLYKKTKSYFSNDFEKQLKKLFPAYKSYLKSI